MYTDISLQKKHQHNCAVASACVIYLLFSFIYQAFLFTHPYRPDEYKAISFFLEFFTGSRHPIFTNELATRLGLFLLNLLIALSLAYIGLVKKATLIVAILWPMTTFLFSKIYWEFFFFPLCLMRLDLRFKHEVLVLSFLAVLLIATGEANLGVLVVFRGAILVQRFGYKTLVPTAIAGFSIALDAFMKTGLAFSLPWIGRLIQRFDWTRNFANPEYSPIESLAVFILSFHFFSLHTGAIWIDAFFSFLVIILFFGTPEFRENLREHWWLVLTFFSVFFFFTHITYAFQNARYYYFYIAILGLLVPQKIYLPLGFLGLFHFVFRSMALI